MSAWTHCDNECGMRLPVGNDGLGDWLQVRWPGFGVTADYCTAACAVVGIERARDEDAARQLAAMDDLEDE